MQPYPLQESCIADWAWVLWDGWIRGGDADFMRNMGELLAKLMWIATVGKPRKPLGERAGMLLSGEREKV